MWCAVAEYVEDMRPLEYVSAEEIDDILLFAEETGYSDWVCNNVMRCEKNGKIVFIDTEKGSFQGHYDDSCESLKYILQNNKTNEVALELFNNRIKQLTRFNDKNFKAVYDNDDYVCVYTDEDKKYLYNLRNVLREVEPKIQSEDIFCNIFTDF